VISRRCREFGVTRRVRFKIRKDGHFVYSKEVMSTPSDFGHAVELYRKNYVEYRATGKAEHKIAYENAERWIQLYLESIARRVSSGAEYINNFVTTYQNSNADLVTLRDRFRRIRTEGPALQDQYTTVRRVGEAAEPEGEDWTSYYVKGAIAAGLLGIVAVMSGV
jgi:hypothetical protein